LTPFFKKMVSKGIAFGGFRQEGVPVAKGVWGGAPALPCFPPSAQQPKSHYISIQIFLLPMPNLMLNFL
jgi:hypothetical protein